MIIRATMKETDAPMTPATRGVRAPGPVPPLLLRRPAAVM